MENNPQMGSSNTHAHEQPDSAGYPKLPPQQHQQLPQQHQPYPYPYNPHSHQYAHSHSHPPHYPAPVTMPTSQSQSQHQTPQPQLQSQPQSQPMPQPKKPRARKSSSKAVTPSSSTAENNLPHSRVQKIIKADFDIGPCQKEAVFLISAATEYFVQKLSEAAYAESRLEQNSMVQYRNIASAVRKTPDFHWLQDVVPTAIPLNQALAKRKEKLNESGAVPMLSTFDPTGGRAGSSSPNKSKSINQKDSVEKEGTPLPTKDTDENT